VIKKFFLFTAYSFFLSLSFLSNAEQSSDLSADFQEKVKSISAELRCLVCQNQTIADSNASLAVDLRNQVSRMLRQGKSEQEIKQYMVERYGDFVLYDPPVKERTWALWFGPFLLLAVAIALLVSNKLKRRVEPDSAFNSANREDLRALLRGDKDQL
jgi:cytochrome c-type biogenesis protein CcmH